MKIVHIAVGAGLVLSLGACSKGTESESNMGAESTGGAEGYPMDSNPGAGTRENGVGADGMGESPSANTGSGFGGGPGMGSPPMGSTDIKSADGVDDDGPGAN